MLTIEEIVTMVGRPDPVILDIGCNDGEHTQMFLDAFPDARVFCFEPDPRARLRFLTRVNSARAVLFGAAVGAQDGKARFYQSGGSPDGQMRDWDLSGSIRKPKNHLSLHPWCTFDHETDVPLVRLDTWMADSGLDSVDFIWADVQGAEGDLIAGGAETLARTRYFYTEYNDHEMYEGQPTLDQLRAMLSGFELLRVYADDVLFARMQ